MACEISPICDFLFGSIRMNLLTDMVDIELTVQMVKRIYTYRKDHTSESIICTLWSKKVTTFPSLRHNIQAHKDRNERVLQWGNTFQFSAPSVTQTNQERGLLAKSELGCQ